MHTIRLFLLIVAVLLTSATVTAAASPDTTVACYTAAPDGREANVRAAVACVHSISCVAQHGQKH